MNQFLVHKEFLLNFWVLRLAHHHVYYKLSTILLYELFQKIIFIVYKVFTFFIVDLSLILWFYTFYRYFIFLSKFFNKLFVKTIYTKSVKKGSIYPPKKQYRLIEELLSEYFRNLWENRIWSFIFLLEISVISVKKNVT